MIRADSLGFLAAPGSLPVALEDPVLDLIHLTAAPPWVTRSTPLFKAVDDFIPGISVPGGHTVVRNRSDLEKPGLKIVLGLQNAVELSPPVDNHLFDPVLRLYEQGIRIMQLAYQDQNPYGSGFAWPVAGLTTPGRRLIEAMAKVGMILDLAHSSQQTARDALKFIASEQLLVPVMISHTGCYRVYPHLRNLPDDVLRGVAKRGGVVGIFGLTFCLHQTSNEFFSAFMPHLRHALEVCGPEAVCVGTDIPYNTESPEAGETRFQQMQEKLDPHGLFNLRYPDYLPGLSGPAKLNYLAASGVPEPVLGENLFSFLRRSLS